MITGLTIGLGVDYSLHVSERFNQELAQAETVAAALHETITGTGGALLSSAATTASGFAVLLVAILPFLQSFGLITALTIVFAFLASVFVLPSLLVVWARVVNRDAGLGESTTGTATESPDSTAEGKADVTRTVHRSYLSPDQVVPVTVSLRNVRDRMILRESVDGEIGDIDLSPEPVAVDRDDGAVTVYWDTTNPVGDAMLEYVVELPEEAVDGDVVTFEGTVESSGCQWSVGGEETATVVEDIFQRVLERGAVTAADIEIAIERDDITPKEIARLRRAWLKGD
jgi:hypothetical protein